MSLQEQVRELFLLDQQVRGLRSRLDDASAALKAQQTKLSQLTRQRDELAEQVKQAKVKGSGLEHQVGEADARIAKLRDQMNSVKSNKEYSALLIEVNTLKVEKNKVEEETLAQMGQVEMLQQELVVAEEKVAQQQKMVHVASAEVEARRQEVGARLDQATRERDEAQDKVPADARTVFHKQADIHDGEALAVIVEESRRHLEYCCGGCYMGLPIERVNVVMMRPDTIVTCPSCGRILYMDAELKASMGVKS